MKNQYKWQLQEAKNKFSRVAEDAVQYGPQVVTKRGKDAVVILSVADYERLRKPEGSLVDFLMKSPLRDSGIEISRDRDDNREIEL